MIDAQIDMGYDISNYEEVYPPYGTVKDMDNLIAACHERFALLHLRLLLYFTLLISI